MNHSNFFLYSPSGDGGGDGGKQFDYSLAWQWLQQKGSETLGHKFKLCEDDRPTINLLLCYFLQDKIVASDIGLELQKGILLTGPVGCGKTSLMKLMKYYFQNDSQRFFTKPCRDVSFEFIQNGFEIIHRYTRFNIPQPTICFDDLGTESALKYYGNECNVMAEVILSRYDLYVSHRLITHLTTNLSASEIETLYGNRVRSRLREMFNLIAFDVNSLDKRT